MKSLKLMALGVLALGLISTTASAVQTKVYITGSSAFRTGAINAITDILTADGGAPGVASNAGGTNNGVGNWDGSSTVFNFSNTNWLIKCAFQGSASGVQIVAASTPITIRFLADAATGTSNPDPNIVGGGDLHTADIAFSDVYQATTPFSDGGVNYNDMTDTLVGIVGFKWMASKNFPYASNTKTMTPQFANYLFTTGFAPLSMLSGVAADTATLFATGRNPDSGTRYTAILETKIGLDASLKQYKPTISAGAVTSHVLYPIETINGISTNTAGNSGEVTGAILRGNMTNTLNLGLTDQLAGSTANYYITYLSVGDAGTVITGGGKELNYNGVAWGNTAVATGQYQFWCGEHCMWVTDVAGFGGSLVTKIKSYTTASGKLGTGAQKLSDLAVFRDADGGPIKPGFYP